jgi:hypothetical protein
MRVPNRAKVGRYEIENDTRTVDVKLKTWAMKLSTTSEYIGALVQIPNYDYGVSFGRFRRKICVQSIEQILIHTHRDVRLRWSRTPAPQAHSDDHLPSSTGYADLKCW